MDDMRYAHYIGHTDICYDDTGKYIITCGTDGDIRIWNGLEEDDLQSHHMGLSVSAVAHSKNALYLSPENFQVVAYSFPEAEFEQIIAQFNTTVYHIVCSKDGKYVACGGGDFIIKMYDTSEKSLVEFRGHSAPVLSLALDPKGKYLASSGCDGTVRLWLLSSQECVKTLNLFKKSNDLSTSSTLCRIDWSSDGQLLSVPVNSEIHFYERDVWNSKFSITDDSVVNQTLSIVTYSPSGKHIAAAALNGQMLIWDVGAQKCISRKLHNKEISVCGLKWNPSGMELAFSDVEGQLGIYSSPLKSDIVVDSTLKDVPKVSNNDLNIFDDDDDDEDDENAFDIGAIKASLEPKIFSSDSVDAIQPEKKDPEPKIQIIEAPKAPVQTSFQPSSTPASLERRFMLWNNVGIVRCYNTEEENSIDVEFHDTNIYHPLHVNNTKNHTMAALSTEALLLASPKLEESTSKLECMHFGTWDSNKEWIVEMPKDEEIETIALGEGFAACVTDKRYVRLFSISGIQCEIFLIPGPVVSCTARNKQLIIVYHKGSGVSNDQCLNMMIVKVQLEGHSSIKECFLPLSSKAFLSWIGYSDEGSPCIVDTSGIISLLSISCGTKWIPVANTALNSKGKSDTYFVIGLSEIKQEIRCILCKGSRYPALLPKPTIAVIPFSLPFCDMSTDKGKLEEESRRYALAHKCMETLLKDGFDVDSEFSAVEKKWMDALLKMFALATRTEREYRAMNVAELMPNPVVIQGAIRYATQRHRIALAERLGDVMNKKLSQNVEEDDDFDFPTDDNFTESLVSKTPSQNPNLFARDDTVLKPKPLSRIRGQTGKSSLGQEDEIDYDAGTAAVLSKADSLIPKSSPVTNPFKASPKGNLKKEDIPFTSNIDDKLNKSMKNVVSRNSMSDEMVPQPKKSRFQMKKEDTQKENDGTHSAKGKTGFDLFFEENRENIRASASSDVNDKELVKLAMLQFKELPKSEKQKYLKKTNSVNIRDSLAVKAKSTSVESYDNEFEAKENSCEMESDSKDPPTGKCKENADESDEATPKVKRIKFNHEKLSDSTVRKLTQFAFTKTPK